MCQMLVGPQWPDRSTSRSLGRTGKEVESEYDYPREFCALFFTLLEVKVEFIGDALSIDVSYCLTIYQDSMLMPMLFLAEKGTEERYPCLHLDV